MAPDASHGAALLRVQDLARRFATRAGTVRAVDGVSFEVHAGRSLAIIGESGCGKTTTARMLLRLEPPSDGQIWFRGRRVDQARGAELADYRRHVQAVFQDPYGSLSPRMPIRDIIGEPLAVAGHPAASRHERVSALMQRVGLDPASADRYPHEFSGGQRQRIAIARSLCLSPALIVLDEPVSALDVSIRAQVINLLMDLQDELGIAYVLISHDLDLMFHICHDVVVMYLGQVVESGPAAQIAESPRHPYTRMLMTSRLPTRPVADRRAPGPTLDDELPSPLALPSGCRFRTRCPHAQPLCSDSSPSMTGVGANHRAACHLLTPVDPTATDP